MSCSADTASQRKKGKYKFDVALIYANNKKTLIILKIIRLSNSINFQLTSEVPVLLPDQLENSPAPINSLHQTFPCLFISLFPPFHTFFSISCSSFPSFSICHHAVMIVGRSWTPLCYQQELRTNLGSETERGWLHQPRKKQTPPFPLYPHSSFYLLSIH